MQHKAYRHTQTGRLEVRFLVNLHFGTATPRGRVAAQLVVDAEQAVVRGGAHGLVPIVVRRVVRSVAATGAERVFGRTRRLLVPELLAPCAA